MKWSPRWESDPGHDITNVVFCQLNYGGGEWS